MFMGARDLSMPSRSGYRSAQNSLQTGNGAMVSDRLRTRLTRHEAVLVLIDRRRTETGNPNLGWALEKKVLEIEIADLEAAIVAQESTEHAL
jgi:hypothetical protein